VSDHEEVGDRAGEALRAGQIDRMGHARSG
jgi:hypothetical protein